MREFFFTDLKAEVKNPHFMGETGVLKVREIFILQSWEEVDFITLRKQSQKLTKTTEQIPEKKWQKVMLSISKQKYRKVSAYESSVILRGCKHHCDKLS